MPSDLDRALHREIRPSSLLFQRLIGTAEDLLARKQYLEAAAAAQIAGSFASYNHTGVFVSPRLERVLLNIGTHTTGGEARDDRGCRADLTRVLHVVTAAGEVGGDTRFVWRWIQRDADRSHSVAFTHQRGQAVPPALVDAVAGSGGACHMLDSADVIQRARVLRTLARNADVVFLHVYPEDVVPLIAFADKTGLPPVVFVVQADHQFWLGTGIADLVVHLRDSGRALSIRRRGIDPARMGFLPIPLDEVRQPASRLQAREKLGIAGDTVVLLSIARAFKYDAPAGQPSFATSAANVLAKHQDAVLLVVGPRNGGQWKTSEQRTGGRMMAMGRRSDTAGFYEAADIYLDSFPFSSNTSLLEAASHGLPLVSYFPYSDDADVLGPGAPGFDGTLLRVRTIKQYEDTIARLIEDRALRIEIGERTKRETVRMHSGDGWQQRLDALYRQVLEVAPAAPLRDAPDAHGAGEVDLVLKRLYSTSVGLGGAIDLYTRPLPYVARLRLLRRLVKVNRSFSFSMFLPKWLETRVGGRLRGWRQLLPATPSRG